MGMHPWQLDKYEPQELFIKYVGHCAYQSKKEESQWRQTRLMVSTIINFAGKVAKKPVKPSDIIRLPGDRKITGTEKRKQMQEIALKMLKNNG